MKGPTAYVVAITRWAAPLEQELGPIAQRLGLVAYDVRLRLGGPVPVIAQRTTDPEEARAFMEFLRDRGHGVVGCDVSAVAASEQMATPRAFRLEEDAFVGEVGGRWLRAPWESLVAFVRAAHDRSTDQHTQTTTRKLSLGRAALTGGLSVTKKQTVEKREASSDREQVLYLFRGGGEPPLLLCERGMRYDGLGDRLEPTAGSNFATLVELLRQRAPGAFHDQRLVTDRRRASTVQRTGTASDSTVSTSNAGATDLAAHLLVLAHLRGQL